MNYIDFLKSKIVVAPDKGIGIELNEQSFHDGLCYMKEADELESAPTLFDLEAI